MLGRYITVLNLLDIGGPKIWDSLPTTIKESKTLAEFKNKNKKLERSKLYMQIV